MDNLQVIDQRSLLGKDFKVYGDFENPLFFAKDVAEWIEYSYKDKVKGTRNVNMMLEMIDEDEKLKATMNFLDGNNLATQVKHGGYRANTEMWFLTEDGLYEVLMQSRKPIAKKFKKEVKKILKSIRINGMYVAQAKVQEKMFNTMKIEMTGLVDEIVSDKISEIEEKCSQYYRPTSSQKWDISQYIKKRLGISKADDEYELVKQRVLIKLNATKWEDIPVEVLRDSLNIIDESIRVIKADRTTNQISLFEIACSK